MSCSVDVEGLVLDLPSGAGAVGEFSDVVAVDVEAGDEGAAVGDGAVGSRAGDLQPVDAQGVVAVADGQAGHPPVAADAAAGAGGGAAGGQADAVEQAARQRAVPDVWLSQGMRARPNSVCALDRVRPSASAR